MLAGKLAETGNGLLKLSSIFPAETRFLALALEDDKVPTTRLEKAKSLLGGQVALEVNATGVEEGKFITRGLSFEDLLYEMGAACGVTVTEEKDGFGYDFLIAKGQGTGKCEQNGGQDCFH